MKKALIIASVAVFSGIISTQSAYAFPGLINHPYIRCLYKCQFTYEDCLKKAGRSERAMVLCELDLTDCIEVCDEAQKKRQTISPLKEEAPAFTPSDK